LRYLKGTPGKELYYRHSSHLDIVGYYDVDWAGDPINRHYTTSYRTFVGGNLGTWRLKNKMILLDPMLNLSIESWLTQLVIDVDSISPF